MFVDAVFPPAPVDLVDILAVSRAAFPVNSVQTILPVLHRLNCRAAWWLIGLVVHSCWRWKLTGSNILLLP